MVPAIKDFDNMSSRTPIKITKKISEEPAKRESPIFVWDFTCPKEGHTIDSMREALVDNCKLWAFQVEKGEETGYIHFQGRFSLKNKARLNSLVKTFSEFKGIHFSPTSNNVAGKKSKDTTFNYVVKVDTRIEGPWTDRDCMDEVPEDLKVQLDFYPFQQSLWDMAGEFDGRALDNIIDPIGAQGKTYIIRWMDHMGRALELPFSETYRDIGRAAYCLPTAKAYLFDLPRAIPKNKLNFFYAGLETLKNGKAWDDRHKHRCKKFTPPRVFVFTNTVPNPQYMSLDRWRFWIITKDRRLERRVILNGQLVDPNELNFYERFNSLPDLPKSDKPKVGSRWNTKDSTETMPQEDPVPSPEPPTKVENPGEGTDSVPLTEPTGSGQGIPIFDEVISYREPARPKHRKRSSL